MTTVGVLALQGDVREHAAAVTRLGATATLVRRPRELDEVDAIILPGGESTTIDKLLRAFDLRQPLIDRVESGLPVLGSCAGMILLATDLIDGIEGQQTLGAIPMTVRRNAFGRQVDSAEASLTWLPDGSPMSATFIRAPWVESYGEGVEVLATAVDADGATHAVAVQFGSRLATAFHPEISDEPRVHQRLLDLI
ncbi:pyridoxal 5'-phosphate synthase glutaminase subunit PdxT [Demequina sp. NBRC 110053]|uniref:pyridoxal 5'-phosphate synthase glutaminase subunit PdxT n=1 Tax=Demequina sp. NBRC 110053 TaxID=1570342 RepID=UPI000A022F56|nr:pyridoxal 5'-phosphate synthase glutaminase subunit PdxT [Demequina sp. NBRC 110053]